MATVRFIAILLAATCFLSGVVSATDKQLYILLTVTCFLGGVVSVTDKQFEVCTVHIVGCYLFPGWCCIRH